MAKQDTITMETEAFNKAMKKFMSMSDVGAEKSIKKIAFMLLGHIIGDLPGEKSFGLDARANAQAKGKPISGRHPVDTGRSRAGWYASMRGLQGNFDFSKDSSGHGNIKPAKVAQGKKDGSFKNNLKGKSQKYVDLINGVDYIMYLEYGRSTQAPAGMVRIGMRKMTGAMPKVMGKQFLADWNRLKM